MTDVTDRINITIINKQSKVVSLMCIPIPNNSIIDNKYEEEGNKYIELKREIQELCNLKTINIILVVVSFMKLILKIFP